MDIDHTIWDSQRVIPDSVPEAFARLQKNGHLVFLNSGRARGHIYDERLLALPMKGIVAACGTHIEADGELLYARYLPWETLQKALALLREESMPYILEGREYHWMNIEDFAGDAYVERLYREMREKVRRLETLQEGDEVNKFSAAATANTDIERIRRELDADFRLLFHNETVAEFIAKDSGKAKGMERVCELFDIPKEQTYAIGDSVNDLDMLEYAAHGICMGNGSEVAKAAAEYVTDALHEDGLYKAMEHYGLI